MSPYNFFVLLDGRVLRSQFLRFPTLCLCILSNKMRVCCHDSVLARTEILVLCALDSQPAPALKCCVQALTRLFLQQRSKSLILLRRPCCRRMLKEQLVPITSVVCLIVGAMVGRLTSPACNSICACRTDTLLHNVIEKLAVLQQNTRDFNLSLAQV